jgi:hypothetical protein
VPFRWKSTKIEAETAPRRCAHLAGVPALTGDPVCGRGTAAPARCYVWPVGPIVTPTHRRDREQPIGALVPAPMPNRSRPRPAPFPDLPVPRAPVDLSGAELVLGVACPDRSGRVTERAVLLALHWTPGHRIDVRPHCGILLAADWPGSPHGLVARPTQDVDLFANVDGAAGAGRRTGEQFPHAVPQGIPGAKPAPG